MQQRHKVTSHQQQQHNSHTRHATHRAGCGCMNRAPITYEAIIEMMAREERQAWISN